MSADTRVKRLVVTFAHGVLEIVRDDVLGVITRLQGEFEDVSVVEDGPTVPATRKPSSARPKGVYPEQLAHGPYCEWPGCVKQHRGPRNHFLCEEHKNIAPKELAEFLQTKKLGRSKKRK